MSSLSFSACMNELAFLPLTSLLFLPSPFTAPVCMGATPPAASLAVATFGTSSLTFENVSSLLACMIKWCRSISSCMRNVASPHLVLNVEACNLLDPQALSVKQHEGCGVAGEFEREQLQRQTSCPRFRSRVQDKPFPGLQVLQHCQRCPTRLL